MSHSMSVAVEYPDRYRFLCDKVAIFGETITDTPVLYITQIFINLLQFS
jgi:hypothetical protein